MIEFWIALTDGTWLKTEGAPIPGIKEFDCLIHVHVDGFRVSERSSGLKISFGQTQIEAIEQAKAKIKNSSSQKIEFAKEQARLKAREQADWHFQEAMKEAEKLCQK